MLQVIKETIETKKRRSKHQQPPTLVAEPSTQSNSFVGTEEYIAPVWSLLELLFNQNYASFIYYHSFVHSMQEIITGAGHSSAIDWWALGEHVLVEREIFYFYFFLTCNCYLLLVVTCRNLALWNAIWSNTISREEQAKNIWQHLAQRPHLS